MPYKPFEQLRKPKNENPKKTRKPENITEEIRKKEAEKIVFTHNYIPTLGKFQKCPWLDK